MLFRSNAGQDGSVVAEAVRQGEGSFGYNALTGEYADLVEAGIIDPAKVTRTAIQNASSVAGILLTAETVITELPSKDDKAPEIEGVVR